ncbi:hypothetical protein LTR10_023199 [Elasticomyces elasticus]|uniref:Acid phosphatase n=1 Tax=Exophiala sideris TaxID=1016849 RepID=A0ABR0J3V4_9EURO|nr:hypothetical protein LTR10_023199 [Elasticomyces elasticus]KAK5024184.1 hypothetical protein LTS07_008919 [Exophiala sideris]KAK5028956.1 hypothetical protein LTR13_008825 [Exophiala sideris]KAK5054896.1 hypothetical protein LTR69_008804 [Exophiala sideris]KAK5178779.1 hypothetical protein LTR44_008606 [Eurotiomycetes sp. CCFEE 6388]
MVLSKIALSLPLLAGLAFANPVPDWNDWSNTGSTTTPVKSSTTTMATATTTTTTSVSHATTTENGHWGWGADSSSNTMSTTKATTTSAGGKVSSASSGQWGWGAGDSSSIKSTTTSTKATASSTSITKSSSSTTSSVSKTSTTSTKAAASSTSITKSSSSTTSSVSKTSTTSVDWVNKYTATAPADVLAAQATAKSSSPTSHVPGKAFDRFVVIWLENTDYNMSVADPNLAWLAQQGITLSNYFGVTHPSESNYVAAVSGDNYGIDNDDFIQIPANVSTIVDLLEDKGISWAEYQEDMPYAGFEGVGYVNQQTQANDYVRKHNPLVIHNSCADSERRLSQMKNLTAFYDDLKADTLPQWLFVTPNMTSDGHDTSVTVAGAWTRNFLEPLLKDSRFMKNTMVLVTFDENHTYTIQNRVLGILLGDAVPTSLAGTTDSNFYDHYSEISTVEANWDLHTLGRWDAGANVFDVVGKKTGDKIRDWPAVTGSQYSVYLNTSFAGAFSDKITPREPIPAPNITMVHNGRSVLPSIVKAWSGASVGKYYKDTVEIPDGAHPPQKWY